MEHSLSLLCGEVGELLRSTKDMEDIFFRGQKILGSFAARKEFLRGLFSRMAVEEDFFYGRRPPVDPNEITLHREPAGLFSLRLYIWDPAIIYPVHSHGSWGVVSCVAGQVRERKYRRLDDGTRPGYAKIEEIKRTVLQPGETTTVLPLNDGIHQMESSIKEHSSVSLHLYGRAVRPGYLEFFNRHKDTVYRVVPPVLAGRLYVLKALGAIKESWSADILAEAARDKKPYVRFEAIRALAGVDQKAALARLEAEEGMDPLLLAELRSLLSGLV